MILQGTVVPLVTPLTDQGRLDEASVDRLVDHVLGNGEHPLVDGVLVNGTTGEFQYLGLDTQKRMLRCVVSAVGGRVPVAFNATGEHLAETLELFQYAEKNGAQALVLAPKHPGWTSRACEHTTLPVYLYNYADLVEDHFIGVDAFRRALDIAQVWGLKDSVGEMVMFLRYQKIAEQKPGAVVFMGNEKKMKHTPHVVPSYGNFDPLTCQYMAVSRDVPELVDEIQKDFVNRRGKILYCGSRKIRRGLKYGLHVLGICGPFTAEPGQALRTDQMQAISSLVNRMRKDGV